MEVIQTQAIYNSCTNKCKNLKRGREDDEDNESVNRYKAMRKSLDKKGLFEVNEEKLACFFNKVFYIEKKEEPLQVEQYEEDEEEYEEDEEEVEEDEDDAYDYDDEYDYDTDSESDYEKYRYDSDDESDIINILSDEIVVESDDEDSMEF